MSKVEQALHVLASESPLDAADTRPDVIAELESLEADAMVIAILRDGEMPWPLRCGAATYLGAARITASIAPLIETLDDDVRRVTDSARDALAAIGEDAVPALQEAALAGSKRVQRQANSALRLIAS